MAGYQQITIVGHVGRDPEMRYTQAGKPITSFSMAVSRKYNDEEKTTWFNIACWEKLAETANNYVVKGRQVMIVGRVELNEYTRKDGTPGASLQVTANQLVLLGSKGDAPEAAPAAPAEGDGSLDEMPF